MNSRIIKFNTAYGSSNLGDYIINESADRELAFIFNDNFVINYPTHTPVIHFYQAFPKNLLMRNCRSAKYKFLCGTNILSKNMMRLWPNWNVGIANCKPYHGTILVGCGMAGDFKKANYYTRCLYKKILSKDYVHSARDEKTKCFLERMGYKAINTGCVTLWSLSNEHCKEIPQKKGESVIFTLTDYCRDYDKDKKLVDILRNNYKKIYYWVQGSEDYDYFKELIGNSRDIVLIYSLESYRKILQSEQVDYVGTRLHAGIFAMQHKRRSIILIVDNRARDMKETYSLVAIERNDIDKLEKLINSNIKTNIKIDERAIAEWKGQFSGSR